MQWKEFRSNVYALILDFIDRIQVSKMKHFISIKRMISKKKFPHYEKNRQITWINNKINCFSNVSFILYIINDGPVKTTSISIVQMYCLRMYRNFTAMRKMIQVTIRSATKVACLQALYSTWIRPSVPYFRGDWSWNIFYGHSSPFRWFIQEGLL